MASITFNAGVDPNNVFLNIPSNIDSVATATTTSFEVGDPRFTVLRLEGTGFTYSSQGVPSAGIVTGFSLVQAGMVVATVTDLAPLLGLQQVETLRLSGVADVVLRYLLSSDDVSTAGPGDQVIVSEGGNDTLDGGEGADYISAGEGNDLVVSRLGHGAAFGSTEVLIGGGGVDKLIIDRSDQALALIFDLAINGSTTMLDGTRLSSFEQMEFFAGSGNDDLAGGALDDVIHAGGGNDRLSGRGGNDILLGDDGADVIDGGFGNDFITGDAGTDIIDGGSENDTLDGGLGADNVGGGSGDDLIMGREGTDLLEGGSGHDFLNGGAQTDNIFGGDDNDTLIGEAGADYIDGGAGNDLLDGGAGPDVMLGGPGDDFYWVENADDILFESDGEGYDIVVASTSYILTSAAAIDLLGTPLATGKSPLSLTGNGFINRLEGNAGSNTLNGRAGSDTLKGGKGKDTFVFDTKLGKRNVDTILDFRVKDDSILLKRSVFEEISGRKKLGIEAFQIGAKALDPEDRIIYNPRNGRLYYDEDGNGSSKAVLFGKLPKKLKITFDDFLI